MEAQSTAHQQLASNDPNSHPKPKIVVILGATGSGKSKLAVDLASHFPLEIINSDSMQVYQGLDVLTNKVPVNEQKGVPHHLLGIISPNVEFTAKDFRDSAIPLIDEIWSRNHLPVIVGGTNYYIQALVSRFLLDDNAEDLEANCLLDLPGDDEKPDMEHGPSSENLIYTYSHLKDIDPAAANRIHPNDQRKIKQYLSLYLRYGVLPTLDQYVNRRVDLMVSAGLLEEVCDIYKTNADYTRGLRQAIGVREFEDFLRYSNSECQEILKGNVHQIMNEDCRKLMLEEAIEKVKLNTRKLVRRQRRRISRLQMLFGWNIHSVDVTRCMQYASDNLWAVDVVEPVANIIKSFLDETETNKQDSIEVNMAQRDLWTRYVCQACGNKELRGTHEWEQHKQGRCHRKRVSSLRKSGLFWDLNHNTSVD